MTALVDDLLYLARCDAGSLHLSMSPFDLGEVLLEVKTSLQPLAEARSVRLICENTAEPIEAIGNRLAIRRLVLILVDNAIKYSRPGGTVHISAGRRRGQLYLRVADQGFGIPSAELPFVFQRFYRGAAAYAGNKDGLGLGLALANGIAQQHGSKLEVTSTSPDGSIFELMLPLSPRKQNGAARS